MAFEREETQKLRLAVLLLAVAACSVAESEPEASLEFEVSGQDSRFDDPADLAGIRVEITGAGPNQVYLAPHVRGPGVPPFRVPDTGQVTVSTQIAQDDEIVVQGSLSWELLPGTRWTLLISRAQEPSYGYPSCDLGECPENTRIGCGDWYCRGAWRFAVREDAARVEHDSLWMVLYRVMPDECADICWK